MEVIKNQPNRTLWDSTAFRQANEKVFGTTRHYYLAIKAGFLKQHFPEMKKWVEIGTGCGDFSRVLKELNFEILGLEREWGFFSSSSPDWFSGQVSGDARFLPFKNGAIPGLVTSGLLHHLSSSALRLFFGEAHRVIKTDGILVSFDHNPLNVFTRRVVRSLPYDRNVRLRNPRKVVEVLLTEGWKDIHWQYLVFFPPALGFLLPLENYLGILPIGAQWVIWARK